MMSNWQDDLQSERSVWDAVKESRKLVTPHFNYYVRCAAIILGGAAVLWAFHEVGRISNKSLVSLISWASSGLFTLTVGVIGFLIAGFSIFVTLADRSVLIELAQSEYESTGLSSFKYLFFSFLIVFVYYIAALMIVFVVGAFSQITWDSELIPVTIDDATRLNIVAIFALWIIFVELMIRLKSFIWTVYSSFISQILVADFLSSKFRQKTSDGYEHDSPQNIEDQNA
jgi:hypothetical protein